MKKNLQDYCLCCRPLFRIHSRCIWILTTYSRSSSFRLWFFRLIFILHNHFFFYNNYFNLSGFGNFRNRFRIMNRDANYRRCNNCLAAHLLLLVIISRTLSSSIYVGVFRDADAEARHMPAGARQTSGLTQILRWQLRPGFHRDWWFPSRRQIDRKDNR